MKSKDRIWVHPDYKKLIKKKSVDLGIPAIDLTKILSQKPELFDNIESMDRYNKPKRRPFDFKI